MLFVRGGTLGLNLLILGLRLGDLGIHFGVCFAALGPNPGPLFQLFWKIFENGTQNKRKRELKIMHVQWNFELFLENAKNRFDCAGANGLRFRPLLFWLSFPFFAFVLFFWRPPGAQIQGVAGGTGTPLLKLIQKIHY